MGADTAEERQKTFIHNTQAARASAYSHQFLVSLALKDNISRPSERKPGLRGPECFIIDSKHVCSSPEGGGVCLLRHCYLHILEKTVQAKGC